ncbi:hypothetical protein JI721_15335 [Alicyclobacillus cycloheptanicus]|uniref:Type II secretory pathway pseudopilin PulG n=1 Tax=Alicyclobacillus cycloheptanicus TaxID=1457 RepID=A0ABT9XEY4_9BACL|nr:hypothetical protein [Alicyclobacillus cycloheptanicus]MDQ0188311.1 type II secretory pathway pseudopilin PulG [Alicyclobacillus cycloheptanicus]WDM01025.1 hypothetical protein JI721_15335 [Alicyclobacillus cycloheptanicus]
MSLRGHSEVKSSLRTLLAPRVPSWLSLRLLVIALSAAVFAASLLWFTHEAASAAAHQAQVARLRSELAITAGRRGQAQPARQRVSTAPAQTPQGLDEAGFLRWLNQAESASGVQLQSVRFPGTPWTSGTQWIGSTVPAQGALREAAAVVTVSGSNSALAAFLSQIDRAQGVIQVSSCTVTRSGARYEAALNVWVANP